MGFLELVKNRYSVRSYLAKNVSRDILERCLEAARLAPSACNSQPWYFIVVDNPELKERLAEAAFCGIYSLNDFAKKAPVLVAVITEKSCLAATLGATLRGTEYNRIDIGIACEHFILKACEEGLGSCWFGWFNEKAVKKILKVAPWKKIDVMISLGYPDNAEPQKKERKPLSEISKFI
jgi:nitroreductase